MQLLLRARIENHLSNIRHRILIVTTCPQCHFGSLQDNSKSHSEGSLSDQSRDYLPSGYILQKCIPVYAPGDSTRSSMVLSPSLQLHFQIVSSPVIVVTHRRMSITVRVLHRIIISGIGTCVSQMKPIICSFISIRSHTCEAGNDNPHHQHTRTCIRAS